MGSAARRQTPTLTVGSAQADQDGDGNISLGEIHSWVKPRVSREAKKSNRDQNPTLTVGKAAGDPGGLILAAGVAR